MMETSEPPDLEVSEDDVEEIINTNDDVVALEASEDDVEEIIETNDDDAALEKYELAQRNALA